jgi:hypothetical protein
MMIPVASLLLLQNPVLDTFKKIEVAHAKLDNFAASIREANTNFFPIKVFVAGNKGRLVLPTQRIVEVQGKTARFYDQILDQVAESPIVNQKPIQMLISAAVVHREPIGFLLDNNVRSGFLSDLKKETGWKQRKNQLSYAIGGKKTGAQITHDGQYRITRLKVDYLGKTLQDWRFEYVAPSAVATISPTARKMAGLTDRPQLPRTTAAKTVIYLEGIWRAMARWRKGTAKVVVDGQSYSLSISGNILSENSAKGSWQYAGKTLTATTKSGSGFKRNVSQVDSYATLMKAKMDVSPFARYFLMNKVPFLELFDKAKSIQVQGQIPIDGVNCKIVKLQRFSGDILMYVDGNNRVHMVSSSTRDESGNLIQGTRMKLIYQ